MTSGTAKAEWEGCLGRNACGKSVIYDSSGTVVAPDFTSERERAALVSGSAADGTDGAGLTSQIDVQARGEVLGVAHGQENCSAIEPGQRHMGRCLIS